jgi:uncharacterized protein YggE
MMHEYKVEVERDGRWWIIHVPEIDQLTQARRIDEIEDMARSLIAISTDVPAEDITMQIRITVPPYGDVGAAAERVRALRKQAAEAEERAAHEVADYVRRLTKAGIPVRDTAELLGVSPQRVSQLANA